MSQDDKVRIEIDPEQAAILDWFHDAQDKRQAVILEPEQPGVMVLIVIPSLHDEAEKKARRLCQGNLAWLKITVRTNWWEFSDLGEAD